MKKSIYEKDLFTQTILQSPIPCNLLSGYKHLYNKEINIRPDQPENITRLLLPRKPNVGIRHNIVRHRGSIVMQNRLAARYSGEVYLVKHDL
ncbi:phospho-sugar glycosidase domain-containing protein [Lactobacillus amylovorus]|uniref:phospho-sugar glycosidase domain-containing protein n=1 Tax=Lactobacillus amylovorus TaxID=1604 RepID=UPI003F932F77